MDLGLKDKVALVTGGSQGIGKACALRFAQEGAKVAICARQADRLERTAVEVREATGGDVLAVPTDVTRLEDIQRFIARTVEAYGGVDILVNNAGTAAAAPFDQVSDEAWYADLDLKLLAAVRCSREVVPYMRQRGGGHIVNLTAIGGRVPTAASTPTSVSRAAGIALTKAMSRDLAKDNILVNTVCIGLIKSGQWERRWEQRREGEPGLTLDEHYGRMGEGLPLSRVGEAEEAANLIVFLASPAASYITGVAVNMDGGVSAVV